MKSGTGGKDGTELKQLLAEDSQVLAFAGSPQSAEWLTKEQTVLMMGVRANMCILNRSFGIRQLTKWGMHCILVRDLTDAMYNPASAPHVSHSAGTELVIEHIERFWSPSVLSGDLLRQLRTGL